MNDEARRRRISPGVSLGLGILVTLFFGVFGAFGWLAWVWWQTPETVRATVSSGKRGAVIAFACTTVAASTLGLLMTILGVVHAFHSVESARPEDKARQLAEGISSAMNWTAIGLIPIPFAVIVALVAGFRLLRATQETDPA